MRSLVSISFLLFVLSAQAQQSRYGPNDTLVVPYVVYNGDTMTYAQLDMVMVYGNLSGKDRNARRQWTRLRNAVYVTYPYAKKAGYIINDVNMQLTRIKDERARKKYLSSREKELKKEFTEPLTSLSVYQGKVLMKLINRETSNNCYTIIKEYRGGFSARFWQTIAWVFGSSLKQDYDPKGEDAEMEAIVQEVARMYGHAE
ncbi:MAG: DUF4294 domain-containing protein [Chitinophagaceae bacterium]